MNARGERSALALDLLLATATAAFADPLEGFAIAPEVDALYDRPAMYGSHHEISVVRSDGTLAADDDLHPTVVSGPLCESGDIFTLQKVASCPRAICLQSDSAT